MNHLSEHLTRKEVLEFISDSVTYGNLGAFIGAGFSKAVLNDDIDQIALSWGELLENAANRMGVDYAAINKVGVGYPDIASVVAKQHAHQNIRAYSKSLSRLKREIAALTSWYPDQDQRERFSKYLKELSPHWIITTNYDLIIEGLLTGIAVPLGPNDSLSSPAGTIPVFHLHGVRTNPEEIIIAQEDYVSLFRPNEYRQIKLALTIKESTTLLLGYGLGDVNVLTALDWSKNVFRSERGTYPNDVIQVLRKDNPADVPYRDKNGIVILETADLSDFFEAFCKLRENRKEQEAKDRSALQELAAELDDPDSEMIEKFIDDRPYRQKMLELLSDSSIHLVAGFVSLLNKCIDETWARAEPSGAFAAYNQNLSIILDILIAFPVSKFPPALFQTAAYGLQRVGYYIGDGLGKSWEAKKTWEARKTELSHEVVDELNNVAEQHGYYNVKALVRKLSNNLY